MDPSCPAYFGVLVRDAASPTPDLQNSAWIGYTEHVLDVGSMPRGSIQKGAENEEMASDAGSWEPCNSCSCNQIHMAETHTAWYTQQHKVRLQLAQ